MIDYAKMPHMDAWLRHPVLGDPSFDTFERLGEAVHCSQPPFEMSVNCSVFRDFDDIWYYYAGLYGPGYIGTQPAYFRIYRTKDRGVTWEDLGRGFPAGFRFAGESVASDVSPDAVVFYDEKRKKYLLTYDTATNAPLWESAPSPDFHLLDGAAIAWGDTPAGPFERLPHRMVTSCGIAGKLGRFNRYYASTVIPREKDYLALVLMDSGRYFAWGLAALTAPAPEGPWSEPQIVLSCDREEYFPCPVEFYPAEVHEGVVHCAATSVAKNRNYQVLFQAPLEQAHCKEAWHLTENGNRWHSRNRADEYAGIWGQTYQGFVEPDTGRYVVAFPSRDARDYGMLCLAARPWDTPHSDGFTISAHSGPAMSPLLAAYEDVSLEAAFAFGGTVDVAFAYRGILGPNDSTSDAIAAPGCMADYSALRLREKECAVISVSAEGAETVHAALPIEEATRLRLHWQAGKLSAWVDGRCLCESLPIACSAGKTAPLALLLQPHSYFTCETFAVSGQPRGYTLR